MGGPPSQNGPESFVSSLKATTASYKHTTSAMSYFTDTRSIMRTWCQTSGEDVFLIGWVGQATEKTARQAMAKAERALCRAREEARKGKAQEFKAMQGGLREGTYRAGK